MLLKTKDMQHFIREKIDFDKKKLFKKYLRCKAANILQNKNQVKQSLKEQTSFKYTQTNKLFLKPTQTFIITLYNHFFIQLLYKKTLLFSLTITRPSDVQTFLTPYFFELHLITAFMKMSSFQLLTSVYLSAPFYS